MEVETLISQMQDTLVQIRDTINELSTKAQDDEIDKLEEKQERLLADLQNSFEKEKKELEAKRRDRLEEIKKKRRQEDEEREARRRQEDKELEKANSNEDMQRQKKRATEADSIEDETKQKIDRIEEAAERTIQEGKQKLHELDEKRQELNRRIDEQLKQSLPAAPSRKRAKPKNEPHEPQKNGVVGDSTSPVPKNNDSSTKASNKPDTPSKPRPSSAADSPTKSPEVKKDGELPFRERSNGYPQTMKGSSNNLPRSFAEALKNNVSNGSKGKPKPGKPSLDDVQQIDDNHGEHNNGTASTHKPSQSNNEATFTRAGDLAKEIKPVDNTELVSNTESQAVNAMSREKNELSHETPSNPQPIQYNHKPTEPDNVNPISAQDQPASRTELIEQNRSTVSNLDHNRGASMRRPNDQLHIPIADGVASKQLNGSGAVSEHPEVLEAEQGNNHTPERASKEEADTVEDSKSAFQPSRLSATPEKRSSRRNDKETYDQMGLEQSATSDTLEQGHAGDDRNAFDALRSRRDSDQLFQLPVQTVSSASPVSTQGEPIVSLNGDVPKVLAELGGSSGIDKPPDTTLGYFSTIEKHAQGGLASPLPVENETVHGQDQLFEDNKSISDTSESDTDDEHSDSQPYTPIEGQDLPVLLESNSKDTLGSQGLTTLIGGSGDWAMLTEEEDKSRPGHLTSTSTQGAPDFKRHDTKAGAMSSSPRGDDRGNLYSKVDVNPLSTRQDSPVTCNSADQAVSTNSGKEKGTLQSDNIESHSGRSKQRGRPRKQSFESPERALNPRELLFQGSEGNIDIRSNWFKRSKRGLG